MTRANYSEDIDTWPLIRWRGAVTSAIRGRRGQAFLRELVAALDALPEPALIANDLEYPPGGHWCALGAVGRGRALDMQSGLIEEDDHEQLGQIFGIAPALIREIMNENDEFSSYPRGAETERRLRWKHMRAWASQRLLPGASAATNS